MRAFGVRNSRSCMRALASASGASSASSSGLLRPSPSLYSSSNRREAPPHIHSLRYLSSSGAQANRNTFVSSYYQLEDPQEIAEFLGRKKLVSRETDTHFIVRDCPFCHPTRGKTDNIFKLYVQKAQGVYKCHRCGASGSWFDFKSKVGYSRTMCRLSLRGLCVLTVSVDLYVFW